MESGDGKDACGPPFCSAGYNDEPWRCVLPGVRSAHRRLFALLAAKAEQSERARHFGDYMAEAFGEARNMPGKGSHLPYVLGWMLDSNGREGAALKSWACSRFGLDATWHGVSLSGDPEARAAFDAEAGTALAADPAAFEKFDLMYEFAQFELATRPFSHVVLYRGTGNLSGSEGGRRRTGAISVRLNCLNSFTRGFERAWEFGDRVIEARVPTTKIFFDDAIFRTGILTGEEEVIVLGGEYEVALRW